MGNAERIVNKLSKLVTVDREIRIHWTGCPNSCGQVQAADIGIMGAPAKKIDPETGKKVAVPGCKIFVEDDELIPVLIDILKREFGAVDATDGGEDTSQGIEFASV